MSGTAFDSSPSTFHGEPPPFSDVIIPPSDYSSSAYLEPNSSRPNSSTSNTTLGHRIPAHHDSGVVADCSFDRNPQVSPRSTHSQPRSPVHLDQEMSHRMKRPESLAVRGHEYEELPTARQEVGDYSEVNADNERFAPRTGPPMMTKLNQQVHTDNNDNLLLKSGPPLPTYRKRQNPLYDSNDHEESTNVKVEGPSKSNGAGSCPCPCWILICLALVGGVGGLCLALYNFTYYNHDKATEEIKTAMVIASPNNKTLQEILTRLQKLEEENQQLSSQVTQLQSTVFEFRQKEASMLSLVYSSNGNISLEIQDLSDRINNIQLQPGPEGPQGSSGAGNLSQCVHKVKSAGGLASESQTNTSSIPDTLQHYQDFIILGVECTTEGGLHANLYVQKVVQGQQYEKYKCICSGNKNLVQRYCEIHYWQCPPIS